MKQNIGERMGILITLTSSDHFVNTPVRFEKNHND